MKKPILFSLLLVSSLILTMYSCKDDGPIVTSQLIISPEQVSFNDNDTIKVFLSVQPPQSFQWSITSKPDWLRVNPGSGTLKDKMVEVEISVNSADLSEGIQHVYLEFITNGAGKAGIECDIHIEAHPEITLTPLILHFGEETTEQIFTIKNTGKGFLNWSLEYANQWLYCYPNSGMLYTNQSTSVTAVVSRVGIQPGTISGNIVAHSNTENSQVEISVSMDVPEFRMIDIFPGGITFDFFIDQVTAILYSTGNIASDWTLNCADDFITASHTSGNLPAGDSLEVRFSIDRTNLTAGSFYSSAVLTYGDNHHKEIMFSINNYIEEKWLINGHIIDAEYDRVNDVIIAVSASPNQLRKFDPISETETVVALSLPPTCVSVSPDGNFAAVGHNARVSYVDLTSMQVQHVYHVTTNAIDIVLPLNGWVYVFPATDQWERIRCINLTTGVETLHTGNSIRAGTLVKLHPSGNFIYGADNGLSPSDFEKYDISGGTAVYLYDSPYHGSYSFGGNIWISDDGTRLFARSRNVFTSSDTPSLDMLYNGNLAGQGSVKTLDHHSIAGEICAVFVSGGWSAVPDNEVRFYNAEYLAFTGTISLPGFFLPDGSGGGNSFQSQGYFVFFNSNATHIIALVYAGEGTNSLNNWAITTHERN
jgi:hypothetical protein